MFALSAIPTVDCIGAWGEKAFGGACPLWNCYTNREHSGVSDLSGVFTSVLHSSIPVAGQPVLPCSCGRCQSVVQPVSAVWCPQQIAALCQPYTEARHCIAFWFELPAASYSHMPCHDHGRCHKGAEVFYNESLCVHMCIDIQFVQTYYLYTL